MKKIIVMLFLLLSIPVMAINITAQSNVDINKDTKDIEFSAKVIKGDSLKNNYGFYRDDIIEGTIVEYIEPKRAKRAAYIIVAPKHVYRNNQKLSYNYNDIEIKVKKYSKKSFKEAGIKGGVTAGLRAGGIHIPGLSQIYYFSKGFLKPEKDKTRLASGARSVYENSPLSYIEKGKELCIEKGDSLALSIYYKNVPKWQYFKKTK